MIKKTFYKDRPAISVENENITAVFLPLDGGKFASFKTKDGKELLAQRPEDKYRRLFLDSDYVSSECSAFDDMFPTIDPCQINGMDYLDHGEVCRREHTCEIINNKVTFCCELPSLNVTYSKTVYIENNTLCIKYSVVNHNEFAFPYIWAGHIMFNGEDGAYAVSNFPKDSPMRVMFGSPESESTAHILPHPVYKNYKFYYTEPIKNLKCGVVYPQSQMQVNLEVDNDVIKYLGIWVNPGDLNNMYNIALEPCSAPYDSPINAQKENVCSFIAPKDGIEFTLKISYNKI